MAMGISRLFKSTDVDAPAGISRTAGSLNNVLKAVLVDGYGTTESLGWTLEFEAGNVCVYRQKGGTRMFYRVDDGLTDYWLSGLSFFKTMSSVDLGVERVPPPGAATYFHKTYSTTSIEIPWMIIGDDAGIYIMHQFWLCLWPTYNGVPAFYWDPYYFGDYVPIDIRNTWNFCSIAKIWSGNTAASNPTVTPTVPDSVNYSRYLLRDSLFNKGAVHLGIAGVSATYYGHNFTTNGVLGWPGYTGFGSRLRVYSTVPQTNVHGVLPGVLDPWMQQTGTYDTTTNAPQVVQSTDQDNNVSLRVPILYSNSNVLPSNSHNLIFRVGKGFRNV